MSLFLFFPPLFIYFIFVPSFISSGGTVKWLRGIKLGCHKQIFPFLQTSEKPERFVFESLLMPRRAAEFRSLASSGKRRGAEFSIVGGGWQLPSGIGPWGGAVRLLGYCLVSSGGSLLSSGTARWVPSRASCSKKADLPGISSPHSPYQWLPGGLQPSRCLASRNVIFQTQDMGVVGGERGKQHVDIPAATAIQIARPVNPGGGGGSGAGANDSGTLVLEDSVATDRQNRLKGWNCKADQV